MIASEPDISRVPIMIDSPKWSVIEAGLEVRPGQGDRQLDLDEGRRGPLPRTGPQGAALTVPPSSSWPLTNRAKPTPPSARSKSASAPTSSSPKPSASRPKTSSSTQIFAVATGIEEHNGYGLAFIEATRQIKRRCRSSISRAAYRTCPSPSAATSPCARRCTPCSSTTPSRRAWTWASSTPASSPSTMTSPPNCATSAKTWS